MPPEHAGSGTQAVLLMGGEGAMGNALDDVLVLELDEAAETWCVDAGTQTLLPHALQSPARVKTCT